MVCIKCGDPLNLGKYFCSKECRNVGMSEARSFQKCGQDHPKWKGGVEASRMRARTSGKGYEYVKRRRAANPEMVKAENAKRRAARRNACPPWVLKNEVSKVYFACEILNQITGKPHNVDHVMPLKAETLCGLHVPGNLRAVPRRINLRKRCKIPPNPQHLIDRSHDYFIFAVLRAIRLGVLVVDRKRARAFG